PSPFQTVQRAPGNSRLTQVFQHNHLVYQYSLRSTSGAREIISIFTPSIFLTDIQFRIGVYGYTARYGVCPARWSSSARPCVLSICTGLIWPEPSQCGF